MRVKRPDLYFYFVSVLRGNLGVEGGTGCQQSPNRASDVRHTAGFSPHSCRELNNVMLLTVAYFIRTYTTTQYFPLLTIFSTRFINSVCFNHSTAVYQPWLVRIPQRAFFLSGTCSGSGPGSAPLFRDISGAPESTSGMFPGPDLTRLSPK